MIEGMVLLVEDNRDDVDLTLHSLKKNRITNKIEVLRDGAQAIDYFFGPGATERQMPIVMLLDLKLPKISGLDVLRRVRADPRTRRLPVVILTSSNEERDRATGYDNGANSYICKPVDQEQFNDAINQLGLYWLLLNVPPPDSILTSSP